MKRQLSLLAMLCFICLSKGYTQGIQWTTDLSWEQVKQKAKEENKYIFLDCYATWCGPCKTMDKEVYPDKSVGNFFNEKFISVKVQMNRTPKDNENVKSWHKDAQEFNERYVIEGFPSFLFFSPNGKAVYKEIGYKKVDSLIQLGQTALSSKNTIEDIYEKYQRLLEEFNEGKINYEYLPFLVVNAKKRGDTISRKILRAHEDYVSTLPKENRYTKENIEFWSTLSLTSGRKIINFFYNDGKYIDNVMGIKGFSSRQVDKCIQNFTINPFIFQQTKDPDASPSNMALLNTATGSMVSKKTSYEEADWNSLYKMILKNFDKSYAKRNLLLAKITWYKNHSNWLAFGKAGVKRFKRYNPVLNEGSEEWWKFISDLNDLGWYVFMHTVDKNLINQSIKIFEKYVGILPGAGEIDTYANLLYKGGRKDEAIQWQEKAVNMEQNAKFKPYKQKALDQMKKGEPTYLDDGSNWAGINSVNWKGVSFLKILSIVDSSGKSIKNVTIFNERSKESKVFNGGTGLITVNLGDMLVISANGAITKELVVTTDNSAADVILKTANVKKGF